MNRQTYSHLLSWRTAPARWLRNLGWSAKYWIAHRWKSWAWADCLVCHREAQNRQNSLYYAIGARQIARIRGWLLLGKVSPLIPAVSRSKQLIALTRWKGEWKGEPEWVVAMQPVPSLKQPVKVTRPAWSE